MKKLSVLLLIVLLLGVVSIASAGTKYVYFPAGSELLNYKYSSGSGKNAVVYLTVLVKYEDGRYEGYSVNEVSGMGMLGWGHISVPDRFIFIPTNKVKNEIKWYDSKKMGW